jgi:hypothetical protein
MILEMARERGLTNGVFSNEYKWHFFCFRKLCISRSYVLNIVYILDYYIILIMIYQHKAPFRCIDKKITCTYAEINMFTIGYLLLNMSSILLIHQRKLLVALKLFDQDKLLWHIVETTGTMQKENEPRWSSSCINIWIRNGQTYLWVILQKA